VARHEEGDVIADGVSGGPGYGASPRQRAQFIVQAIRTHIGRETCAIHGGGRALSEARIGMAVAWCPACGARLLGAPPTQ
jgi:hypothetical protein